MFVFEYKPDASKKEFYNEINSNLKHLIEGQRNWITNFANASALLYHGMLSLNQFREKGIIWVGFYMTDTADPSWLYLGPFQGKVACTRIKFGRGVCGTAAKDRLTQVVPNVHQFPGHIACDSASNSEIVVPIMEEGGDSIIGVLDIDSESVGTFDQDDREGLEEFVRILAQGSHYPLSTD